MAAITLSKKELSLLGKGVSEDLLSLSIFHNRELDDAQIKRIRESGFPENLALLMNSEESHKALQAMQHGVASIPNNLEHWVLDELAADFACIYLTNQFGASPCESVWIDEDGLMMQRPMFQIRDWYKKYGLEVHDWRMRSDDHLVHQMHFIALLMESLKNQEQLRVIAMFMDEHLLRWLGSFCQAVSNRCGTAFYSGLATLTISYMEEFRDLISEITGEQRPSKDEIDKRMQPTMQINIGMPEPYVPGVAESW